MKKISVEKLYKIFVYVALISLAISIIIPVAWVFVSSLKTNAEFQGSPWTLPMSFYFQNFIDAFEKATKTKIKPYIEEIEVGTPLTYAHYTDSVDGSIYGYLTADLDNMMPRLMRMYDENYLPGLKFCGGHAMRSSGYNSSYLSGDLAAKFTLMDMKEGK